MKRGDEALRSHDLIQALVAYEKAGAHEQAKIAIDQMVIKAQKCEQHGEWYQALDIYQQLVSCGLGVDQWQAALKRFDTPPEIRMEIEDLEREIPGLNQQIQDLQERISR